jgi:glutaminyl-peptide cyclotransferase
MHLHRAFPAILALLTTSCGESDGANARASQGTSARPAMVVRSKQTPTFGVRVVDRIPHDTGAFTQGLVLHGGKLYESTGLFGSSSLRRLDRYGGGIEAIVSLPKELFGEGIAVLDDRLYQLTWKSGIALVYDVATLAPRDTFRYVGEGWGLTSFGDSLIMSDGTSRLRVLDPATFRIARTLDVSDAGAPVKSLNELEYIDGEIWANVWPSTSIARIDPASGRVRAWVDVSDVRRADPRRSDQNVTNGIAYDTATGQVFITGKRWSWVYVVEVR